MVRAINVYSPPVDTLLTLGDPRETALPQPHEPDAWPNYLDLGLTPANIPDLIRMATDRRLNRADEDTKDLWAPVHAWRALGQLRAEEAVAPLLALLDDAVMEDDEWLHEEVPEVFGLIGPAAIPPLAAYLADEAHEIFPRLDAREGIERIGTHYPEARDAAVAALTRQLDAYGENDADLNGFLINSLVHLKAVEAAPLIERAFAADAVDLLIRGGWDDAQIDLGLKPPRVHITRPRPREDRDALDALTSLLASPLIADSGATRGGSDRPQPAQGEKARKKHRKRK